MPTAPESSWVNGLLAPTFDTRYPGTEPVGGVHAPWDYLLSNGAYNYYRDNNEGRRWSTGIDVPVALSRVKPNLSPPPKALEKAAKKEQPTQTKKPEGKRAKPGSMRKGGVVKKSGVAKLHKGEVLVAGAADGLGRGHKKSKRAKRKGK